MILNFSQNELLLLVRGMTAYMYVSFSGFAKPDLHGRNREIFFEATYDKLFAKVEADRRCPSSNRIPLELANDELALLCRVIEVDVAWCDVGSAEDSAIDYNCHFSAERQEVVEVLAKLRTYI